MKFPVYQLHERHKCNAAGLWQKVEYFLAGADIVRLRVENVRVRPRRPKRISLINVGDSVQATLRVIVLQIA